MLLSEIGVWVRDGDKWIENTVSENGKDVVRWDKSYQIRCRNQTLLTLEVAPQQPWQYVNHGVVDHVVNHVFD